MAERPIIFSAPMVRAILAGTKSQTRRVVSPDNCVFGSIPAGNLTKLYWQHAAWDKAWPDRGFPDASGAHRQGYLHVPCHVDYVDGKIVPYCEVCDDRGWEGTAHRLYPRLVPGDRLWCREAWAATGDGESMLYRADPMYDGMGRGDFAWTWRSPIHLPRWASRLTLTVTDVRVQRLQDISEADAIAEGMIWQEPTDEDREWARARAEEDGGDASIEGVWIAPGTRQGWGQTKEERTRPLWGPTAAFAYRCVWNHLHGPGSWDANPWVTTTTFTAEQRNIDAPADARKGKET